MWGGVFEELFSGLRALSSKDGPEAHLRALCSAYVEYWIAHPDYYRLVFIAQGVTKSDVSLLVDNPEIIAHFSILLTSLQNLNPGKDEAAAKKAFDFMLSTLHRITHNKITNSGYDWSPAEDQIKCMVKAISQMAR